MAVYKNLNHRSPLSSVEFTPVSDGNFTFFYVDTPLKKDAVKSWVCSPEFGQEVIAETTVGSHPVLITHGDKTQEEILAKLSQHGDKFGREKKAVGFKDIAWPLRSILGFGGQGLQLTSSVMGGKVNAGLLLFSLSNITANTMALTFGAQRSDDDHRLRFLKEEFNDSLGSHIAKDEALPNPDSDRSILRNEKEDLGPRQKLGQFLRRNSVMVGEIGLRYIGAFGLAFPATKWKGAWEPLSKGAFKEAYKLGHSENKWMVFTGLTSIVGKTIALTSKAEDPYDPKPKSTIDFLREKVTFKLGGAIETVAFGAFTHNAFTRELTSTATDTKTITQARSIEQKGNYLSGAGGAMFTTAYIIRNWAKFGVKETNMDELNAHITDSLAKVPPEQLPQLMADTAASMKDHFKDKPMDFGKVFTQLMTDMYRYHHIALDNLGTEPEERFATTVGNHAHTIKPALAQKNISTKRTLQHSNKAGTPPSSHAQATIDRAKTSEIEIGLGA